MNDFWFNRLINPQLGISVYSYQLNKEKISKILFNTNIGIQKESYKYKSESCMRL